MVSAMVCIALLPGSAWAWTKAEKPTVGFDSATYLQVPFSKMTTTDEDYHFVLNRGGGWTYLGVQDAGKPTKLGQEVTYNNPGTVTFSDVGKLGDRSLSMDLHLDQVKYGASATLQDVSQTDTLYVLKTNTNSEYKTNLSFDPSCLPFYNEQVHGGPNEGVLSRRDHQFTCTATIYYTDDASKTPIDLPFYIRAFDIDQIGRNALYGNRTYYEGVELLNGFDTVFTHPDNWLQFDGNYIKANESGTPTNEDDQYTKAGFFATTNNGSFKTKVTMPSAATGLYIGSQYLALKDPSKTVAENKIYQVDDEVTFTVTQKMGDFYNDTLSTYSKFELTDVIPEGLTYKSASANVDGECTYDDATKTAKFAVASSYLSNKDNYKGQNITWNITCTVDDFEGLEKAFENQATRDIDGVTKDTNKVNITAKKPVLAIEKSVNKETTYPGDITTWTIKVRNTVEGTAAKDVVVKDPVPTSLKFNDDVTIMGSSASQILVGRVFGEGYSAEELNSFDVKINTLPYGETASITFTAETLEAGEITNVASATASNVDEGVEDDATVTSYQPELALEKSVEPTTVNSGDEITWTIKITQPVEHAVALDVVFRDEMPEGFTPTQALLEQGLIEPVTNGDTAKSWLSVDDITDSIKDGVLTYELGRLAHNVATKITIKGTIAETFTGSLLNTASTTSSNAGDAKDDAQVEVLRPVLNVVKTVDKQLVSEGDEITWTVDVTQTTEGAIARKVVIDDVLPEGFTAKAVKYQFLDDNSYGSNAAEEAETNEDDGETTEEESEEASNETGELLGVATEEDITEAALNGQTIHYETGADLGENMTMRLVITGSVDRGVTGMLTNTASAVASNADKAEGQAAIEIGEATLAIVKDVAYSANDGSVQYIIKVKQEKEGVTAKDVVVTDPLPKGFTYKDGKAEQNGTELTLTHADGVVTVNSEALPYGEEITITLNGSVADGTEGDVVNVATATASNAGEVNDDATFAVGVDKPLSKDQVNYTSHPTSNDDGWTVASKLAKTGVETFPVALLIALLAVGLVYGPTLYRKYMEDNEG